MLLIYCVPLDLFDKIQHLPNKQVGRSGGTGRAGHGCWGGCLKKSVRTLVIKENRLCKGKVKITQKEKNEENILKGREGDESARPEMEAGVEEELYLRRGKEKKTIYGRRKPDI